MNALLLADAEKLLRLLLSECNGADAHSWRKCRRCLAFAQLEGHDPMARRLMEEALSAVGAQIAKAREATPQDNGLKVSEWKA